MAKNTTAAIERMAPGLALDAGTFRRPPMGYREHRFALMQVLRHRMEERHSRLSHLTAQVLVRTWLACSIE